MWRLRRLTCIALVATILIGCGKRGDLGDMVDDGSAPPTIRERGQIRYPDVFPYLRGKVSVLVSIGITGNVTDTEIVEATFTNPTNSELFVEAARDAARGTSFTPSRAAGGYPQKSKYVLNYYFKLSHEETFDPKGKSTFVVPGGQEFDDPPKLVHSGQAVRPLDLMQDTGLVEIELLVDEFGRVYGTKLVRTTLSGEVAELMTRRVRDAALRHEFEPAMKDDKPVSSRVRNVVTFEPVTEVYP